MSETTKKTTRKTTKRSGDSETQNFTDAEKAAMKARAKELKAETRASRNRAAGESDLLAKIAEMPEAEKAMASRLHELITANAPNLMPKTWYGMPAYANQHGKVVCFFQAASKFEARYSTLGFNDAATLDDGNMWEASFALVALKPAEEEKVSALVRKAVGAG